jgi:hypothetical protein
MSHRPRRCKPEKSSAAAPHDNKRKQALERQSWNLSQIEAAAMWVWRRLVPAASVIY